jgi:heat shock protein HslJ
MNMKALIIFFIISMVASCTKEPITTENKDEAVYLKGLTGKWKAVSLFLSDATTGVCHMDKPNKDITFEFGKVASEDKTGYTINGQGPVNSYFGKITFASFDETKQQGKITISSLGSTKMAGSPEMMACEQNFFTMLSESTGFQLYDENPKRLIIGKLRDENSHPRDGGTYFVFEKID